MPNNKLAVVKLRELGRSSRSPNWPRRVAVLDAKQDSPNIELNMKMDFIGLETQGRKSTGKGVHAPPRAMPPGRLETPRAVCESPPPALVNELEARVINSLCL
jgi:hypothetical protein